MNKQWISMHIFYSANPSKLLLNCIAPLIAELRDRGLVSRWFFIRYWMGGPHVRLRLLPAEGVTAEAVKNVAEPAIRSYLDNRPALFEMDPSLLKKHYRRMFEAEYGTEAYLARYGETGEMETYLSNSIHYIDYELEFERYGGAAGLDVAERHFEVSSDIVLDIMKETNVHVRGLAMGRGMQLMLQLLYTFLVDDESVCRFLTRYIELWQEIYEDRSNLYPYFDRKYNFVAQKIQRRVRSVKRQLEADRFVPGLEVELKWITHVREFKTELRALRASEGLLLPDHVQAERDAFNYLLSSYVHMTNNRLSVSIGEEVYMAYVLRRAIEDSAITVEHVEAVLMEASIG
ncbi:MAG TPA: thiopeptide-type bacteriocin biosynthesis protein [Pyrinomonadaceae bacterium]|jgi:thiopeptide-type bacteriocin biosynthesis protein